MRTKRFLGFILAVILVFSVMGQAAAAETTKVVVNGKYLTFDVPPTIVQGRTLVPVRAIFEELGVNVAWDSATRTVIATKADTKIELPVDRKTAKKNGRDILLDVPATIIEGRTLVPARFVAESLGCAVDWDGITKTVIVSSSPLLKIHYIDVGQGDCIFIDYGDYDILIDAGENAYGQTVVNYLKKLNTDDIELMVATHPDSDHIGGMDDVLSAFKVEEIIDSGVNYTTQTYKDYMATVNAEVATGAKFLEDDDMTFDLGNGVKFEIIETGDNYSSNNANSVVCKLTDNGVSALFTGDMDKEAEANILSRDINVDILKQSHHGSRSASSPEFMAKVSPAISMISAGLNNKYGHPHPETLSVLGKYTSNIYGTWLSGDIVITVDGTNYFANTDKKVTVNQEPTPVSQEPGPVSGVMITAIDLDKEIVTIQNTSSNDVDMTGWKLVSVVGNQSFGFPGGFIIKAGQIITIASGRSTGTLKWSGQYIWNNDGDPGILYDNFGKEISKT